LSLDSRGSRGRQSGAKGRPSAARVYNGVISTGRAEEVDAVAETHAQKLGHVNRTYCAEVLSPTRTPTAGSEPGDRSHAETDRGLPQVKVLLIAQRVEGFFLERFTDRGDLAAETQHETLDEAMWQAYSEYDAISDWRLCPDDADPLEYMQVRSL
jgi:hypothetical protein